MRVESGGRTTLEGRPIVSSAGAMGLMQLMPGTWRDMRAVLGLGPDPHDPHDNILAGTAYLRLMYDRFGYPGLFAAYNAGPARYAAYFATGRRSRPRPALTSLLMAQAPPRPFRATNGGPRSRACSRLLAPRRNCRTIRRNGGTVRATGAGRTVPDGGREGAIGRRTK